MVQIDLLSHLLRVIVIIIYFKPDNFVQIICIRYGYF